jgi:hypothetical protein
LVKPEAIYPDFEKDFADRVVKEFAAVAGKDSDRDKLELDRLNSVVSEYRKRMHLIREME